MTNTHKSLDDFAKLWHQDLDIEFANLDFSEEVTYQSLLSAAQTWIGGYDQKLCSEIEYLLSAADSEAQFEAVFRDAGASFEPTVDGSISKWMAAFVRVLKASNSA